MSPAASWSLVSALGGALAAGGFLLGRRLGVEHERNRIVAHLRDVQRRSQHAWGDAIDYNPTDRRPYRGNR